MSSLSSSLQHFRAAMNSQELLKRVQSGQTLSFRESIILVVLLSLPTIAAQLSYIAMLNIDASMVGHVGTEASASIGLVSATTWVFQGVCAALTAGFSVQMAQRFGAQDAASARNIMKQGILVALGCNVIMSALCIAIAFPLPTWLGGAENIRASATAYLAIFGLSLGFLQMTSMGSAMVQSSGNMRLPSIVSLIMCLCDVVFNSMLIFPNRTYMVFGIEIFYPGLNWGVAGAALGTGLAEGVGAAIYLWYMFTKSPLLKQQNNEKMQISWHTIKNAFAIAAPVAFENGVTSSAQVVSTRIVSPLGTAAIAANSFAITAESLCYQPGYGIGTASTTIIGQSLGADRPRLAKRFAWLTVGLGVLVMSMFAVFMFIFAPQMIGLLSPDPVIQEMGSLALRIGAFSEPGFAVAIVASAALRGAGDTFMSSIFNVGTIWGIRLPIALALCPIMGLNGYWVAILIQWTICGLLFIWRLARGNWLKKIK